MTLAKLQDLSGRVALVTGGSRGLGLQMAEVLGELGARVAISARKEGELQEAKAHLNSLGIECLTVSCDMGDLAGIPSLVDSVVGGLGPIDILVNNAGTTWGQPTVEHTLDGWNKVLTLNLTAKTYRYLDEGEAGSEPAADEKGAKGKKPGKTRREREQEKKT